MIIPQMHKSWNFEVLVPDMIKPSFYLTKIDPNNSPELLKLLSKHIFHKTDPTMTKNTVILFLWFSYHFRMASYDLNLSGSTMAIPEIQSAG